MGKRRGGKLKGSEGRRERRKGQGKKAAEVGEKGDGARTM